MFITMLTGRVPMFSSIFGLLSGYQIKTVQGTYWRVEFG